MKLDVKTAVITIGAVSLLGLMQGASEPTQIIRVNNGYNSVKLFQDKNYIGNIHKGYTDYRKMNDFIKKHPNGILTESASKYGVNYSYLYQK